MRCFGGSAPTRCQSPSSAGGVDEDGGRLHAVEWSRRAALGATHVIGRLAVRDRVEPGAQVLGVAEGGIGAKRGHERLLEAILGFGRPDAGHEEAVQLGGVGVDERFERRQMHVSGTRQRPLP